MSCSILLIIYLAIHHSLISQTQAPPIGQTQYLYEAKLANPISDIKDINFFDFDFPCVIKQKTEEASTPRTIFNLVDINGENLIGEDNGILVWKGFKGKDPFFGVPETFVQFVGGVPIYNQEDPADFNFDNSTTFYLYFKSEDLPENLKTWSTLMEISKIKMKIELSYKTVFEEELVSVYGDESYVLSSDIEMNITEMQAESHKSWIDLPVTDNPVFEQYLRPVSRKFTSLHSDEYPLGTVHLYDEPEFKAIFSFNEVQLNVPDCSNAGEQIYLFPNPNFGEINIKMIDMEAGTYQFDVFNIVGHKMWSKSIVLDANNSLMSFRLPSLEKGVYLYSIKNASGAYLQSRRLVVVEP